LARRTIEDRSLSARREGASQQRQHHQAAFIDEDNVGPLAARPF